MIHKDRRIGCWVACMRYYWQIGFTNYQAWLATRKR